MRKTVPITLFYLVLAAAVVSLIFCALLFFEVVHYRDALSMCEDERETYFQNWLETSERYDDLLREYTDLNYKYHDLQWEYEILRSEYNSLEADYNFLVENVRQYTDKIDYVYSWIAKNSELPDDVFEREVFGCVEGDYINYPCVVWRRDYEYIPDEGDHLKSPYDFMRDGGGDCEDFSFYAAALIRTAARKGYKIKGFVEGSGRFFLSSRWYIPGAKKFTVDPEEVYVVCGPEEENSDVVHCILKIFDGDAWYYFEPQTGEFMPKLLAEDYLFAPGFVRVESVDLNGWYDILDAVR